MKLAVVGSRHMNNVDLFIEGVVRIIEQYGEPEQVISGGAQGADTMAAKWAKDNNYPLVVHKAEFSKYGKSAGTARNSTIVNGATHMLAFPSKTGKGTQDSIRKAKRKGIPIVELFID